MSYDFIYIYKGQIWSVCVLSEAACSRNSVLHNVLMESAIKDKALSGRLILSVIAGGVVWGFSVVQ